MPSVPSRDPKDVLGDTRGLPDRSNEKLLFGDDTVELCVVDGEEDAKDERPVQLVILCVSHGPPKGETGESSYTFANVAEMESTYHTVSLTDEWISGDYIPDIPDSEKGVSLIERFDLDGR